MGLPVEHLTKAGSEFIRQARSGKERGESAALRTFAKGSLIVAAHGDDGNVSRPGVVLQILEELPAVAIRHREISDDNVRVNLPRAAIRLGPVCAETTSNPMADNASAYSAWLSACPLTISTSGREVGCRGPRRSI